MHDKSHVTLEQHVCSVCGAPFDTGALLLDKRLRPVFDKHTVTGWGLCPEHQKRFEEGYVALVACDPEKVPAKATKLDQKDAYRTGEVVHLRRHVFNQMFNVPLDERCPMVFVEPAVVAKIKAMVQCGEEGEQG